MHIPDGLLSPEIWISTDLLAISVISISTRRAGRQMTDGQVPLMGVLGAFVFAAQMVNFPIPGGSSGHLLGAVLLAILLGPWIANIVLFCVFIVQALLVQDGGITALGANFINMGLLGSFFGWLAVRSVGKAKGPTKDLVVFLAGLVSVVLGAFLVALQLWLSGSVPFGIVTISMVSFHLWIGIGEGILTVAVLRFLKRVKPEALENFS